MYDIECTTYNVWQDHVAHEIYDMKCTTYDSRHTCHSVNHYDVFIVILCSNHSAVELKHHIDNTCVCFTEIVEADFLATVVSVCSGTTGARVL